MAMLAMHAPRGRNESGYSGGGGSPAAMGATIAVHALVVGAFILIPKEVIAPYVPQILIGNQIPLDPSPPPEAQPQPPEAKLSTQPMIDPIASNPDDLVQLPDSGEGLITLAGGTSIGDGAGGSVIEPPVNPVREPVVTEVGIDPRAMSAFQPDYPGTMIRQGVEGAVTVRVSVGADGRVTGIERLSATDEAFWIATQRHAMRKWRFRPATRDGVPVPATKVLTVHFRLTDR